MNLAVAETDSGRQRHQGELLRILGVTFGIAVTIGGMIGVGILRTPGTVAAAARELLGHPCGLACWRNLLTLRDALCRRARHEPAAGGRLVSLRPAGVPATCRIQRWLVRLAWGRRRARLQHYHHW